MEEDIKESIPNIMTRLKRALVNASDAQTEAGCKILILVATRIIEKLEKELGISPIKVESFHSRSKKRRINKVNKPTIIPSVGNVLKCGRRKSNCAHTRARKPHSCGKIVIGQCYDIPKE